MSGWCWAPGRCIILGCHCRPVQACHNTLVPLAPVLFSRIALGLALALCPDWICLLGFHFFPISVFSPVLSSCWSSGLWLCKPSAQVGLCAGEHPLTSKAPSYARKRYEIPPDSFLFCHFTFPLFKLTFRYSFSKSPSSFFFFFLPVPQFYPSVGCLVAGILGNREAGLPVGSDTHGTHVRRWFAHIVWIRYQKGRGQTVFALKPAGQEIGLPSVHSPCGCQPVM